MSISKLRGKSAIAVQNDNNNNNSKLMKPYVPPTTAALLRIEPFVPTFSTRFRKPIYRSYSTLSSSYFKRINDQKHHHRIGRYPERGQQQHQRSKSSLSASTKTSQNGVCRIARSIGDQEKLPDRINYDRRGLTAIPIFENEQNLRLLSLQHNLINVFHIPDDTTLQKTRQPASSSSNENERTSHSDNDVQTSGPAIEFNGSSNSSKAEPLGVGHVNLSSAGVSNSNITTNGTNTIPVNGLSPNTAATKHSFVKKSVLLHAHQKYGALQKSKSFMNQYPHHLNNIIRPNIQRGSLYGRNGVSASVLNLSTLSSEVSGTNGLEPEDDNLIENNDIQSLKVKNNQLNPSYGNIFENLVFLDLYDNQIEKISSLDGLKSLTVLLLGKNRISEITGLASLKNTLRVLDLHGNKISNIANKVNCLQQLKSLNLAGNQIRQVNQNDFAGMNNLKELNLKRNRIKRVYGFHHLTNLERLWLCHNEIHRVEDMLSIGDATSLQEVTIENNPVSLAGDCVSFLVSYLPNLVLLSQMPITDQVRLAAMTWRKNKELSLGSHGCSNGNMNGSIKREEVISNARTNWELLRSQQIQYSNKNAPAKIIGTSNSSQLGTSEPEKGHLQEIEQNQKVDSSKTKTTQMEKSSDKQKNGKAPKNVVNSETADYFRLPPIGQRLVLASKTPSEKTNSSGSSLGPNIDSSSSCYTSDDNEETQLATPQRTTETLAIHVPQVNVHPDTEQIKDDDMHFQEQCHTEEVLPLKAEGKPEMITTSTLKQVESITCLLQDSDPIQSKSNLIHSNSITTIPSDKSSNISVNSLKSDSDASVNQTSQNEKPSKARTGNNTNRRYMHGTLIRSQTTRARATTLHNNSTQNQQTVSIATNNMAAAVASTTSKPMKPIVEREREQGGDYLIEICGRYLNIYGLGALKFIDKQWNTQKANDVHTLNFSYVNFNSIAGILGRIKLRFPNAESFMFRETNIQTLGQLNALAELQGISSLVIDPEGNPIFTKSWRLYAIYRLSHWGLKTINNAEVTEEEIEASHREYLGLSDLVLWSLPESLLQPLLARLRLEETCSASKLSAKDWLMRADHSLKVVVGKEALQWKKPPSVTSSTLLINHPNPEECGLRDRGNLQLTVIIENTCNAVEKLQMLEKLWPSLLLDIVRNTLLDYTQIDVYVKNLMAEIMK